MKPWLLMASMVVTCSACAGSCRQTATPAEQHAEPDKPSSAAEAAPNEIRIADEMLRDLKVSTFVVATHAGTDEASMLGEVQIDPDRYGEVAAPIGAQIMAVLVGVNSSVKRGQAVAELRSVEVGRARAAMLSSEARVTVAQQVADRKRALAADRIVALREVQEAEADLLAAQADHRAARAALDALGVAPSGRTSDPSAFVLRAPIGGTVIERAASVGQQVEPVRPLFKIADLSRVWVIVHAFERDAARVKAGGTARVTFAALPGQSFAATVASVGRQVESESRTVPIRLIVTGDTSGLRPGMAATSILTVGERTSTIVAVPAVAVQRIGTDWVVFLPREPGRFEIRKVGRGRDLGGEVEIVSGLKAGETIVGDGAFLLKAEADKARGQGEEHGDGD